MPAKNDKVVIINSRIQSLEKNKIIIKERIKRIKNFTISSPGWGKGKNKPTPIVPEGKVIDEAGPHAIHMNDVENIQLILHDFGLTSMAGAKIDLEGVRDNFHQTFERVWNGDIESDGFNALIPYAGLAPRQVMVLRAMCKFLLQARKNFLGHQWKNFSKSLSET